MGDVYATEPVPADGPLWDLHNVSTHTAGLSVRENERIVDLFCENLRRYLAGDELLDRVDPTRALFMRPGLANAGRSCRALARPCSKSCSAMVTEPPRTRSGESG